MALSVSDKIMTKLLLFELNEKKHDRTGGTNMDKLIY